MKKIKKIKVEEEQKIARIFLINKRDKLDDYIFNCVSHYNEYLFQKISTNKLDNLNNFMQKKNNFDQKTKLILQNVDDMKKEILKRRKEFFDIVKNYANSFIHENKKNTNKSVDQIEHETNSNIEKIKKEIKAVEQERQDLDNLKKVNVEITRTKIIEIRKEIYNDTKFNLDLENNKIQNLTNSHKKFIKDKIEIQANVLKNKLINLNNDVKKIYDKKIDNVYKAVETSKKIIKNEFLFLSEIEQGVIKNIIKFSDFLEDVEYFANDKSRKYEIIFAKAKKIKADNSNKIMKDINQSLSFITNSENVFDNVDLLISHVNQKVDDKILKNKLDDFKDSILNNNSQRFISEKPKEREKND